jgi:biofilm protein TabA
MIFDALDGLGLYDGVHPLFPQIRNSLTAGFIGWPPGKYMLGETDVEVIISGYKTRPAEGATIECHRRYIDLHLMLDGNERIGYAPKASCRELGSYEPDRDFQPLRGELDLLTLKKGLFLVLFPQDAHLPGIPIGAPRSVVKCVLKIPIETASKV